MDFKDVAIKSATEAGDIIKRAFYNPTNIHDPKGKHDIVTEIDRLAERAIIENITNAFPNHSINAEESGELMTGSDFTWYIDPIDGTSNFFTGNPYFAVSIGLSLKGGIVLGVVYVPLLDQLFIAEKGKGALLNNQSIKVSDRDTLAESFIATAYSSDEHDIESGIEALKKLSMASRRVVVNFAPSVDLCNMAMGRIDALVDNGSTCQDHAAGSLILSEAGGQLRNLFSEGWDFRETGIIATNGLIQDKLIQILNL